MKKALYILLAFIILSGIVGVFLIPEKEEIPSDKEKITFMNSSEEVLQIMIIPYLYTGLLDSVPVLVEEVKPGRSSIQYLSEGKYNFSVWDGSNKRKNKRFDFQIESTHHLRNPNNFYSRYYFDLAMDKSYALVTANYIYQTEDTPTLNSSIPVIEANFDGRMPFLLTNAQIKDRNFKEWKQSLPEELSEGQSLLTLIAVPRNKFNTSEELIHHFHNELKTQLE